MITDAELESMRSTVSSTLIDTCVRRRYTDGTPDDYGVPARTSTDATYACRKLPAVGSEDTTDRNVQTYEASMLLPDDADVEGDDVLVHDGDTWQVLGPASTQSWTTHLRVNLRRTAAE